jgi:gluconate 2-dehydrogenase alpha chain
MGRKAKAASMTALKKSKVDAVLVGFGWTGAIMGMELT